MVRNYDKRNGMILRISDDREFHRCIFQIREIIRERKRKLGIVVEKKKGVIEEKYSNEKLLRRTRRKVQRWIKGNLSMVKGDELRAVITDCEEAIVNYLGPSPIVEGSREDYYVIATRVPLKAFQSKLSDKKYLLAFLKRSNFFWKVRGKSYPVVDRLRELLYMADVFAMKPKIEKVFKDNNIPPPQSLFQVLRSIRIIYYNALIVKGKEQSIINPEKAFVKIVLALGPNPGGREEHQRFYIKVNTPLEQFDLYTPEGFEAGMSIENFRWKEVPAQDDILLQPINWPSSIYI